MISVVRPPIHIRRKEKTSTPPKEKIYSYNEVEDILCRAIETFNFTELIRRNSIYIECIHDCKERSVTVTIRQGNEACKFSMKVGE